MARIYTKRPCMVYRAMFDKEEIERLLIERAANDLAHKIDTDIPIDEFRIVFDTEHDALRAFVTYERPQGDIEDV